MATSQETSTTEFAVAVSDARRATAYLIAPEADEYIAIMTVLESSVSELTPGEIAAAVQAAGISLDQRVIEKRLDQLRDWTAVSARTDASRILRHADLLARNWRYTATPVGRQVHRFYRQYLDGTPAIREIPLPSLARIVTALTWLAQNPSAAREDVAEHVVRVQQGLLGHLQHRDGLGQGERSGRAAGCLALRRMRESRDIPADLVVGQMEQYGDTGSIPRRHQPPSGSGVARVTPIRPALQPPAAIMVFMAMYPGVSAPLNRPVPRGVELAFAAPAVSAGLRR